MCGILGIVANRPIEKALVASMRDTMVHRGPDAAGLWMNETRTVALAHRRLAIIDLSEAASQPMVLNGRYVISYNGEIYNYKEIQEELKRLGHTFRSTSDTEVLLAAHAQWGEACLNKLRGMFAFGIWDEQERRLFAARDRVGEKPFYYFFNGCHFVFASELKALTKWPDFQHKISYPGLIDYFTFGYIPSPKTIWEDCYKLEPGHWLIFDSYTRTFRSEQYWDFNLTENHRPKEDQWLDDIRSHIANAAEKMSISDVPLGAFLSGGVDSSAVVAALSKTIPHLKTFSIGFKESEFDELPHARRMAIRYATDHTERTLCPDDVKAVFDRMLWHYDEPFNDFSYLPTYYVCESSRKYVIVALSGDGGDELFCGYPKYFRSVRVDQLNRIIPLSVRRPLLRLFYRMLPEWAEPKRHIRRLASRVPEMIFDIMATGFMPEQMADLVQPELKGELSHYHPREAVERHLQLSSERDYTLINSLRYLDLKMTLAEDMLVKVDRASMAVSLEVRPMLLDIPLVELASHIPARTLVSGQESKRVMKRAVEPLVPRENIYRKKMGFGIPLKVWFWGQLASYVEETRTSGTPFVNSGYFEKILDYHLRGRRDFTLQIHNIVFWHFWARRWGIA